MQNQNKTTLKENLGFLQLPNSQLQESQVKSNGVFTIDTLLSTADEKNGNGRIYPYSVLREATDRYVALKSDVELYGSLDHYDDAEVKLSTVSHSILDLWWKGSKLYGKIEILDTPDFPCGRIAGGLLRLGKRVGVSSRSLGNTSQRGDDVIVESLDIIAYDLVSRPSNHGSVLGNLNESLNYDSELQRYHKLNDILNNILGI